MLPWQNGYIFPIASQQVEIESSHTARVIALGSLACSCARLPYADQTTELCSKDSMRTVLQTNKNVTHTHTHTKKKKDLQKKRKKSPKGKCLL